jgi:sensor histidine kinase YesM
MLRHPWINMKIELQRDTLLMKIMNGKKEKLNQQLERVGTGIENVKKRLELLYKGKYELLISEDEDVFVVNLRLELTRSVNTDTQLPNNIKQEYA